MTKNFERIDAKVATLKPASPAELAVRHALIAAGKRMAPVDSDKRRRILAFRSKFGQEYTFAPVDELKRFEAGIADMLPTLNVSDFHDWWAGYVADKGWNNIQVIDFIRECAGVHKA